MKKTKRFSLMMALVFVLTMFCTPSAFAAANPGSLLNIKSPLSMESKMSMKLSLKGENMSKEDAAAFAQVEQMLSNMTINMDMKSTRNADNTLSNVYVKVSTALMGMPMEMEVWVKYDMTGAKPQTLMVMKMPKLLTADANAKEYMYMDTNGMEANNSMNMSPAAMTEMSTKLQGLIAKMCDDLDAKYKLVSDKGETTVQTPAGSVAAHAYEIKLDDASFKEVLNYMFTTLIADKDFLAIVSDLAKSFDTGAEVKAPTTADIAELTKAYNEFYSQFKDVKLIGDKGIVYGYAISPDNYVVSQNGLFDIVLDLATLGKLSGEAVKTTGTSIPAATAVPTQGKLLMTLEYQGVNFNIDKPVDIVFPTLTKDNSTNMAESLAAVKPEPAKTTTTTVVTKPAEPAKKPVVTTTTTTVKKPVVTKPVVKKPVAKTTITKKPVVKKPVAKKPVAKKPVVKKPVKKTTKKS